MAVKVLPSKSDARKIRTIRLGMGRGKDVVVILSGLSSELPGWQHKGDESPFVQMMHHL